MVGYGGQTYIEKTGFYILGLFFIMTYVNYLSHPCNGKDLHSFSLKNSLFIIS